MGSDKDPNGKAGLIVFFLFKNLVQISKSFGQTFLQSGLVCKIWQN